MNIKQIIGAAAIVALTQQASATVYTHSGIVDESNDVAGEVTNITTSYDTVSEEFTWIHTILDADDGSSSDGFWLVVNEGANPKGDVAQHAIFYGDADEGIVTAYEYNGENKADSYNTPGNLLGSFGLDYSYSDGVGTFSFSLDASDINSAAISSEWTGVAFGSTIGYWLHPTLNATFGYNSEGGLTEFGVDNAGWFDGGDIATSVSEPAGFALLGLGLAGLIAVRRRKA